MFSRNLVPYLTRERDAHIGHRVATRRGLAASRGTETGNAVLEPADGAHQVGVKSPMDHTGRASSEVMTGPLRILAPSVPAAGPAGICPRLKEPAHALVSLWLSLYSIRNNRHNPTICCWEGGDHDLRR